MEINPEFEHEVEMVIERLGVKPGEVLLIKIPEEAKDDTGQLAEIFGHLLKDTGIKFLVCAGDIKVSVISLEEAEEE